MKRKGNNLFIKIVISIGIIVLITNIILFTSKINTSSKFEEITDEQALEMIEEDKVEKVGLSRDRKSVV